MSYAYSNVEIFQLRFIDKHGNEVIRIDNYEKPIIVKKDKLQNKKNRYYFEDTIRKNENEMYFSNCSQWLKHNNTISVSTAKENFRQKYILNCLDKSFQSYSRYKITFIRKYLEIVA